MGNVERTVEILCKDAPWSVITGVQKLKTISNLSQHNELNHVDV